MIGKVHSIETCGTVDGPGIRFLIFTQGCPMRCQYCHNPDTWKPNDGQDMDSNQLFEEIKKYKSYMTFSKGGVTITGGEPLMQPDFVLDLFKKCKSENIHTALDTSGYVNLDTVKEVLKYTDLVLLDIKSINPSIFKSLTSVEIDPTLKLAQYLQSQNIPMWIRHVVVPGLTDSLDDLSNLAKFLSDFTNIEKIEILPFHKMGEYKWETLRYEYELKNTSEPTGDFIEKVIKIFKHYNPNIDIN